MDADLRDLERQSFDSPEARYRYRVACVRAGRTEAAGLDVGDEVLVEEVDSAWIHGPWSGILVEIYEHGDKKVRPLKEENWRVKPSAEYRKMGIYLTSDDIVTLIVPRRPE